MLVKVECMSCREKYYSGGDYKCPSCGCRIAMPVVEAGDWVMKKEDKKNVERLETKIESLIRKITDAMVFHTKCAEELEKRVAALEKRNRDSDDFLKHIGDMLEAISPGDPFSDSVAEED